MHIDQRPLLSDGACVAVVIPSFAIDYVKGRQLLINAF